MKWFYRGKKCAGRGVRLKAEWQAVETIKIEPLSLAARALLIQAGAQANAIHTHRHLHTFSSLVLQVTRSNMDVDMCAFIYTYNQACLFISMSIFAIPHNLSISAWAENGASK